jgi:hypothetical protein
MKKWLHARVREETHSLAKIEAAKQGIPTYVLYDLAIRRAIEKEKKNMEAALEKDFRFW